MTILHGFYWNFIQISSSSCNTICGRVKVFTTINSLSLVSFYCCVAHHWPNYVLRHILILIIKVCQARLAGQLHKDFNNTTMRFKKGRNKVHKWQVLDSRASFPKKQCTKSYYVISKIRPHKVLKISVQAETKSEEWETYWVRKSFVYLLLSLT